MGHKENKLLFPPGQRVPLILFSSRPGTENFSLKVRVVHVFGFTGHTDRVPSPQCCRRSGRNETVRNGRGCGARQLYWQSRWGAGPGPPRTSPRTSPRPPAPRAWGPPRSTFRVSSQKTPQEPASRSGCGPKGVSFIYLESVPHLPPDTAKVILQS